MKISQIYACESEQMKPNNQLAPILKLNNDPPQFILPAKVSIVLPKNWTGG